MKNNQSHFEIYRPLNEGVAHFSSSRRQCFDRGDETFSKIQTDGKMLIGRIEKLTIV